MTSSCFGCVVDNLVPRALNFFHLSVKKMPWVPYITAFVGVIFVLDLIGKLIPTKWRALRLMSPIQVTFCRDNTCHYFCEVKVMTSTKESFCKYSQITVYFSKKVPSKMFDGILNTPLTIYL